MNNNVFFICVWLIIATILISIAFIIEDCSIQTVQLMMKYGYSEVFLPGTTSVYYRKLEANPVSK